MASFFLVLLSLFLFACGARDNLHSYSGQIMGTSYHVTVVAVPRALPADLADDIYGVLVDIDMKMSTYKPDSELMKLNRAPLDEPQAASPELVEVLILAQAVYRQTNGAFDPSVGPLVDLWGFGPSFRDDQIPESAEIEDLRALVGFDGVEIDEEVATVIRRKPLSIDLSAIAKGYAADKVAELLNGKGLSRYMVEVGGEMVLAGLNPRQLPWQIAVEKPVSNERTVQRIVSVTDAGMATSGDYRNYFERDGRRYSHTLDPRTGYPIDHELASVTVIAESSALADALATAYMVMGTEAALAHAESHGVAILTLSQTGQGYQQASSSGFEPYLREAE